MDALVSLLPLAAIAFLVDLPWLYTVGGWTQSIVKKIQGGAPVEMRWQGAPIVYLAIAFLIQHTRNRLDAFWMGIAVYGIYDFTNYAIFKNYQLEFAVADTLWGGVLFMGLREIALRLNLAGL
jgi:uncharacterized membrane protein